MWRVGTRTTGKLHSQRTSVGSGSRGSRSRMDDRPGFETVSDINVF